jgi:hypothetical protein
LKLIETDYAEFLSGDAYTQTGASIPTSTMVFTMGGGTQSTGPIADGGLMISQGNGSFSAGSLEDINDSGTVVAQVPFSGVAAGAASAGGRVVVNLTGFVPNVDNAGQWVIYPVSGPAGSGLLILEADSANVTVGAAFAQTATSFSTGDYGLNLTGENTNGEVDDIAQFDTTATAAPAFNMTGGLDENDQGSLVPDAKFSGTYTPDSPATGRGTIVATTPNTFISGLTLEYYVIDASTIAFIDLDPSTNGFPQVAVGTFELQTPPAGGGAQKAAAQKAAAQSRIAIVHPVIRAHGAFQRK